ncbi:MAG: globin [Nocardioidaceae bacterium]|nr:globin [Nocardioidaceae bacterium]
MTTSHEQSFYDAVGGHETIAGIIDRFYAGVADDPELRAVYPEDDLGPAAHRLTMFFEQYWGGPKTYSEQRGHPRLGMRHAPFSVTPAMRDRWLGHMHAAIEDADMSAEHTAHFSEYVVRAAHFLVNTFDEEAPHDQAPAFEGLHGPPSQ